MDIVNSMVILVIRHLVVWFSGIQCKKHEGRINFRDKQKQPMQVDVDPLKKADSMYLEKAGMNMVEIFEIDPIMATNGPKVDVEMATKGHKCDDIVITEDQYEEKIQVVFPKVEEYLVDFLNRCKIYGSPVMLCPRCSVVFDKKAAKNVEGFRPQSKRKGKWADKSLVSKKQTFLSRIHLQLQTRIKDQRKPLHLPLNPLTINEYFLVLRNPITSLHLQNGLRKLLENLQLGSGYFLVGKELLKKAIRMRGLIRRDKRHLVRRGSFITSITKGEIL